MEAFKYIFPLAIVFTGNADNSFWRRFLSLTQKLGTSQFYQEDDYTFSHVYKEPDLPATQDCLLFQGAVLSGGSFNCEVVFSSAPKHGDTMGKEEKLFAVQGASLQACASGFGEMASVSCLESSGSCYREESSCPSGAGVLAFCCFTSQRRILAAYVSPLFP